MSPSGVYDRTGRPSNCCTLTEQQVRVIKRRIADDEPLVPIAEDYGVGRYAIWCIRAGRTWAWVEGPSPRVMCAECGAGLSGHRRKFCSRKCAVAYHGKTEKAKAKNRECSRKRKLLTRGLAKGHTESEWLATLERWNHKCAYCGDEATERDHVVPLAHGGSDRIDNIVPACRRCNSTKGKMSLDDWLLFRQRRRGG